MNLIEERIRAAARATADTVTPDSVPPLELPAARSRHRGRWHRNGRSPGAAWTVWAAWLAPVATALAVSAIIITIVTLSPPAYQGGPAYGPGATVQPTPTTPSGYVGAGQVPPYFVQIAVHGDPASTPSGVVVRATATGAVLAVVPPTRGYSVVGVTAAASDRRFILDEEPWTDAGRSGTARGRLVDLNLTATGRILGTGPMQFTVPGTGVLNGMVMSPRGDRMAVAYQRPTGGNGPATDVMVFKLAGPGPSRTWSGTGAVTRLSWTADEKELAFAWQVGGSGQPVTARILDLGSSGGSLLGHSRVASPVPGAAGSCQADAIITPDGTTVVCLAPARGFPEYSARNGQLLRVLGRVAGLRARSLIWSGASGRVLIGAVLGPGSRMRVGIISGSTFTPLNVTVNATYPTFGTW